ncbi:hypothetical protein [Natronomonas sp.]|uniref:hypothetical protein n=1 Tax=Natronomonas sp. TaxID=2184060 RepID=UPI002FC37914
MDEPTARKLRFLTLQVVGAVAVVHFVVGASELARFRKAGILRQYLFGGELLVQPDPVLFVVSSVAILAGIGAVAAGYLGLRRAYVLGMAAMAVYVIGWFAWHTVLDHGVGATPTTSGTADTTHLGLVNVVLSHYVDPLVGAVNGADQPGRVVLAAVSKTLEVVAFALLATLLAFDPRVEEPENPVAGLASGSDGRADTDEESS